MQTLNTDLTIYLDNETELSLDSLKIESVIGQGAFGLVRKAVITIAEAEQVVAVKMLRSKLCFHCKREYWCDFLPISCRTRQRGRPAGIHARDRCDEVGGQTPEYCWTGGPYKTDDIRPAGDDRDRVLQQGEFVELSQVDRMIWKERRSCS